LNRRQRFGHRNPPCAPLSKWIAHKSPHPRRNAAQSSATQRNPAQRSAIQRNESAILTAIPTVLASQFNANLADCNRNWRNGHSPNHLPCWKLRVSIDKGMELAKKTTDSLLAKG